MEAVSLSFRPKLVVSLLMFVIVGCSTPSTSLVTPAPTPILVTFTPAPTATIQPPKLTSSPTLTPSVMPLPTLLPTEAAALALELLRNNAGCRLPCWWGFTPGQTDWQTAEDFLSTFASKIYSSGPADKSFEVYIHVPEQISPGPLIHTYKVQNGIIERIGVKTGNSFSYWLHTLLSTYGQPTEVWIRTFNESRDGYLPFFVVLFYSDQGIMVRYEDPLGKIKGEEVEGCPQKYLHPWIFLWTPKHRVSFAEAISWTLGVGEQSQYLPLEEATGMDIEKFHQTFKESNNEQCLKTPIALWQ